MSSEFLNCPSNDVFDLGSFADYFSIDCMVEELILMILSRELSAVAKIPGCEWAKCMDIPFLADHFCGDNLNKFLDGVEKNEGLLDKLSGAQKKLFWQMFIDCLNNGQVTSARKLFSNALGYIGNSESISSKPLLVGEFFPLGLLVEYSILGNSGATNEVVYNRATRELACNCKLFAGELKSAPGESGFCSHVATVKLLLEEEN